MPKFLTIETKLAKEVEPILDDLGLDIETVVKMALKRIVRDHDVSFLTSKNGETPTLPVIHTVATGNEYRISKNGAISLFQAQGIRFNRNITFASKNRAAYNYWANPYFSALKDDWYLILNDWNKRELHLFLIPANVISSQQMICRIDQKEKIDLQICYNDPTYTDNRSKLSFAKYLIKSMSY